MTNTWAAAMPKASTNEVLHINDMDTFSKVALSDDSGLVIVDFYADRCGPCKVLAPIMEELAKEQDDVAVVKVDVDQASDLAGKYDVFSIPTVIIFKDGQEVDKMVWAMPKDEYEAKLDANRGEAAPSDS